jgi:hypothetical protein
LLSYRADYTGRPWFARLNRQNSFSGPIGGLPLCFRRVGEGETAIHSGWFQGQRRINYNCANVRPTLLLISSVDLPSVVKRLVESVKAQAPAIGEHYELRIE